MDKSAVDTFFRIVSKVVIIFPILVIVAAFFLWSPTQKKADNAISPIPEVLSPTQKPTQIDINGSYACAFKTEKNATIEAYIKHKSLFVQTAALKKTTYVLFQKDCLYEWQKNVLQGQMTCGLSQYVSLFESMSKMGLASPDSYLSTFLGKTGSIKDEKGNTLSLEKACQKKQINDELFQVPRAVQFIKKSK